MFFLRTEKHFQKKKNRVSLLNMNEKNVDNDICFQSIDFLKCVVSSQVFSLKGDVSICRRRFQIPIARGSESQ